MRSVDGQKQDLLTREGERECVCKDNLTSKTASADPARNLAFLTLLSFALISAYLMESAEGMEVRAIQHLLQLTHLPTLICTQATGTRPHLRSRCHALP